MPEQARTPLNRPQRTLSPHSHPQAGTGKAAAAGTDAKEHVSDVLVRVSDAELDGRLGRPEAARGVVVFAHGSGSSRHSPRNRQVAKALYRAGFAVLLVDLFTAAEEQEDQRTGRMRFDIDLLARRVDDSVGWVVEHTDTQGLPVGLYGASTGAAGALAAAAQRPETVRAVVSRGGRPDLASSWLTTVAAPTLLVVGALDHPVLELNRQAADALGGLARVEVVPGATHLFEEPGCLDHVATHTTAWFQQHL
ncbi:dienelactone hydrolase family protein [Cryptosporangium arvum]|uniref:Dienelactone hydrolase-like enzyme n=1 Tax=Cryptosporangium arvum DSM 44712 TaxID=927661 RepID=A0A011AFY4_9ACTN|nr:alpha/beta fold hydrolase [Cryptosporangium arvum]EXG80936.1 dienelactone hydrolase-like enzyme [Cryptosporangium arvum DSM 44712]